MKNTDKPIANPYVMLREEFDDWAILFDPDRGHGFGLSPTGVYLWKLIDGKHSIDDLHEEILSHAEGVPEENRDHIGVFVDALIAQGLAAFDNAWPGHFKNADKAQSYPEASSCALPGEVSTLKPFMYDPPSLVNLSSNQTARGACGGGSSAACCQTNPTWRIRPPQ